MQAAFGPLQMDIERQSTSGGTTVTSSGLRLFFVAGLPILASVGILGAALAGMVPGDPPGTEPLPSSFEEAPAPRGISVVILSAYVSAADTEITVRIDGHPELGEAATLATGATLVASSETGSQTIPSIGRESKGREISIRFPQLRSVPTATLLLNGIMLSPEGTDPRTNGATVGSSRLSVELRYDAVTQLTIPAAELKLGSSGVLELSEISRDDNMVVIRGRIQNLVGEGAPFIDLWPTSLTDSAGRELPLVFGRSGFGRDRELFEFAFQLDGAVGLVELRIGITIDDSRGPVPADVTSKFSGPPAITMFSLVP